MAELIASVRIAVGSRVVLAPPIQSPTAACRRVRVVFATLFYETFSYLPLNLFTSPDFSFLPSPLNYQDLRLNTQDS